MRYYIKMTNVEREIIGLEAAEDIVEGDILFIDSDGKAAKETDAEATNVFGIAYNDADSGEYVGVLVRGIHDNVRVLVEDTDSSSGYDSAITAGSRLLVSGKASGTYGVGQALSSDQGTGATAGDGTIVAKAMEAVAGSTSEDTYTQIKCYVDFIN